MSRRAPPTPPPAQQAGWGSLTMNVEILNSLYNVCGTISGPHLDMMKRREQAALMQNNSKVGRRMTWWALITNGVFSLYMEVGLCAPPRTEPRRRFRRRARQQEEAAALVERSLSLSLHRSQESGQDRLGGRGGAAPGG